MKHQLSQDTCQVCFVKPHRLFEYSEIINCVKCGLTCHRSCYLPSLTQSSFKCDVCRYSQKKREACFLCGNIGLLKKVEDSYAHPICLLFSPKAIVLQYSTLTFDLLKTNKREKAQNKSKCSICKKPGELQKCFAQCNNQVHMYCAWKSYQEDNGWNHNPIVQNLQFSTFFQRKAKNYLQPIGQTLISLIDLNSPKIHRIKPRKFQLACPQHTDSIFQCCTQEKYFYQSKIDYIQCDQCFRWYHTDCLDTRSQSKGNSIFTCVHCHDFHKIIRQKCQAQFYLKKFPRLNICEMIYIHYCFEKKNYSLTKSESKFLFSMPIYPSLVFIQNQIKKNITQRLKVQHFKNLCKLNLTQRVDRKKFKDKFQKKYEPILALITETKSLYQLKEKKQQSQDNKSQKNVENQERQKIFEWISLLENFITDHKHFYDVVNYLIGKLKNWLKSLTKQEEQDTVKSYEQESIHSSVLESQSLKFENNLKVEVKAQQMSSQQQQISSHINQHSSQTSKNTSSSKLDNKNHPNKVTRNNLPQKSIQKKEKQNIFYGGQYFSNKISSLIKLIRKKISSKKINHVKFTKKILNQHQDKILFWEMVSDECLQIESVKKSIFLESILKNIFNLIDQYNVQENNQFQDRNQAMTTFQGQMGGRSTNQLLNLNETKITFFQRFRDKILEIYYSCERKIKQKFKLKIQNLLRQSNQFIDLLRNENTQNINKKLSFNQTFNKFLRIPNFKGLSQNFKVQLKQSFDQEQLKLLRLQIQKKKIYLSIKNVEFTLLSSNRISNQYEHHCKSSSQYSSLIGENKQKSQISLRAQILGLQKKALEQWIKMFGFAFNLANQLSSLQNLHQNHGSNNLEGRSSFIEKQPLTVIQQFLKLKYDQNEELHKFGFKIILTFFSKIKESLINFKIFHNDFVEIIGKLTKFCLQSSIKYLPLWTQDEVKLSTMRYLYKTNHKLIIGTKNMAQQEQFRKIWQDFQTDELFSKYMEENKNFIFRDPEVTSQILKQKIPQMISFYEQTQFICRIKQLKRIQIWIVYYFHLLSVIGPQKLVEKQFLTEEVKEKYTQQDGKKLSYNQLAILISELHKVKFPQSSFTKKVLNIFNKATEVENEIQLFFDKSSFCLDQSFSLKQQFLNEHDIKKQCLNAVKLPKNQENNCRMSSAEYKTLMNMLQNNQVCEMLTFQIQKFTINQQRNAFKKIAIKAQQIMRTKDSSISIEQLNKIYFQLISYPFLYINLDAFLTFITKMVQRQQIHNKISVKNTRKQEQNLIVFQKAYGEILTQLESNSKMMCRTLTRQQIIKKLQQISSQLGFKSIEKTPNIQRYLQLIDSKINQFDKIKLSLTKLSQKFSLNHTFEHEEIQALDGYISEYKAQKIYEFRFQIMSTSLEQYKLAFSAIPDQPAQRLMALEQLKSLKKPFQTKQLLKKIYQLEKTIKKY